MAGKVGDVMAVTDGFGFTLWDDTSAYKVRLTIAYATSEDAEAAHKQFRELFSNAISVVGPPS
jgi:hypothetical protein